MWCRLPRAGGQSCSGVALRHPRAVLSSLFFAPCCGVLLRFFARVLRAVNALKTTRGVASKAAGWRPSLCCASLAQRRARGHIVRSARAQVGRQSWRTACVLMPGGIHPQLNRAVR